MPGLEQLVPGQYPEGALAPMPNTDLTAPFRRAGAEMLGLPEAARALRGEMTPEEQRDFTIKSLLGVIGPMTGKATSLGALYLVPKINRFKEPGIKFYDIVNEGSGKMTEMRLNVNDPRKLYVESIGNMEQYSPRGGTYEAANTLGTKEMKSLLPQIKQLYPQAEHIGGFRVSGARGSGKGSPYNPQPVFAPLQKGKKWLMGNEATHAEYQVQRATHRAYDSMAEDFGGAGEMAAYLEPLPGEPSSSVARATPGDLEEVYRILQEVRNAPR